MSEPAPQPDLARIAFPSDRATLGALRRVYPWAFDRPHRDPASSAGFNGRGSLEDAVGSLIDVERRLAVRAYKQALNRPLLPAEEFTHLQETLDLLAGEYVTLGLASGAHHAEQLIRGIESQAVEQARRVGGRGSP